MKFHAFDAPTNTLFSGFFIRTAELGAAVASHQKGQKTDVNDPLSA